MTTSTKSKATKATAKRAAKKAPIGKTPEVKAKNDLAVPTDIREALNATATGIIAASNNLTEMYIQVVKQASTPTRAKQAVFYMWHDKQWGEGACLRSRGVLRTIMGFYSVSTKNQQKDILSKMGETFLRGVPALLSGSGIATQAKVDKLKKTPITDGFNMLDNSAKLPNPKAYDKKKEALVSLPGDKKAKAPSTTDGVAYAKVPVKVIQLVVDTVLRDPDASAKSLTAVKKLGEFLPEVKKAKKEKASVK